MTGLYWEDSELIAKPVNWLVSVKRRYPIEHLRPIPAGKKPQTAPCCQCHLPPECEGHIICCCHSQRDVTVCKIKAAGARLGQKTGSLSREGKKHRLLKTRRGEHLQRRGGEQLSFLQRKCAVEPTGGRFGLSLALIDWGHGVLRHTRKFGVTKLWI